MSILEINDLKVYYETMRGEVKAVDDVSFKLNKGEIFCLVGESGCGKTTTSNTILRILPPEASIKGGSINFDNLDLLSISENEMKKIRWKRISMVFQNAMNALNPVKNVAAQIVDAITTHLHVSEGEAWDRVKNLFDLVGLDSSRLKDYPHEFSGGMRQRVFIAMALSCDPEILIADEPTTGLDVVVQRNILNLLKDLRERLGLSIVLITHDLAAVAQICDRVSIMYAGKIVESGSVYDIFSRPKHPYTFLLIKSFPKIGSRKERLTTIKGSPPSLINPPSGCRFHPRCPYAIDICKSEEPPLLYVDNRGVVACHLAQDLDLVI